MSYHIAYMSPAYVRTILYRFKCVSTHSRTRVCTYLFESVFGVGPQQGSGCFLLVDLVLTAAHTDGDDGHHSDDDACDGPAAQTFIIISFHFE